MIFRVSVVLRRTIVDIAWSFDNLCGSHLQTRRYYHCRHHHHHQHDHYDYHFHHHHHQQHSSCEHKGITLSVQPTLSFMDGLFYPLRVSLWVLMQSIKCWKLFQRRQTANNDRCCWKYLYAITRVWARPRHCTNPALQLELSLSKTAKGTICPLQNLGKKLERKHTRRDLFQYRNCKLKQNVESIFYRTLKGLLILRAVAEPRNLQKHEKYREIW